MGIKWNRRENDRDEIETHGNGGNEWKTDENDDETSGNELKQIQRPYAFTPFYFSSNYELHTVNYKNYIPILE